jgi:hypothetical protein
VSMRRPKARGWCAFQLQRQSFAFCRYAAERIGSTQVNQAGRTLTAPLCMITKLGRIFRHERERTRESLRSAPDGEYPALGT